tara:strand:- start:365121 stop:366509 length:1389 start_codon:yes stop_codon:yes gene_type:complete
VKSPTINLLEPELIELLEARDYRQVRDALSILEPADIADLIESLKIESAGIAFRILPRQMASDVFSELEQSMQESLLDELGDERSARVVEALEPDDRAAILDELPVEVATQIIKRLSPENRRITQAILGYAADSVGRLMTPGYVRIRKSWTVEHALNHIREYGQNAERVDWVFVISSDGTLIDDLHIRTILLADPQTTVADIMDDQFIALNAKDDREEAVRAMARYNRTALPVVDSLGLLVGIVTADDIADVAEEEFTEDVHKLGGMEALDAPYTSTSVKDMVRKRGVWLAGLFVLQLLSIGVMGIFNEQLDKAVVLALFVPMIIASGGNTGTQAASLLVRAIAVDEVHIGLWWRIIRKEIQTGLALGTILGLMGMLTVHLLSMTGFAHTPHADVLALTVGAAVFFIVIWGTLIGSMLPLLLHKLGMDPAASSAPLVATLMDVSGLTIYFGVATLVLHGTLL